MQTLPYTKDAAHAVADICKQMDVEGLGSLVESDEDMTEWLSKQLVMSNYDAGVARDALQGAELLTEGLVPTVDMAGKGGFGDRQGLSSARALIIDRWHHYSTMTVTAHRIVDGVDAMYATGKVPEDKDWAFLVLLVGKTLMESALAERKSNPTAASRMLTVAYMLPVHINAYHATGKCIELNGCDADTIYGATQEDAEPLSPGDVAWCMDVANAAFRMAYDRYAAPLAKAIG